MTMLEQAAYDEGFRDGLATREGAVAQEFEEKRDLELYAKRLELRCERLRAALWGATVVAAPLAMLRLIEWVR